MIVVLSYPMATVRIPEAELSALTRDWSHRIKSAPVTARLGRIALAIGRRGRREIERAGTETGIGIGIGIGIVYVTVTVTVTANVNESGSVTERGARTERENENAVKRREREVENGPAVTGPNLCKATTPPATTHTGPNEFAKMMFVPKAKKNIPPMRISLPGSLNLARTRIRWNARLAITNVY